MLTCEHHTNDCGTAVKCGHRATWQAFGMWRNEPADAPLLCDSCKKTHEQLYANHIDLDYTYEKIQNETDCGGNG